MRLAKRCAGGARADGAEMVERVDAGVVAVAPADAQGVASDLFNGVHAQLRREHLKRAGGGLRVG